MERYRSDYKIEHFGDFTIYFSKSKYIVMAEARYMDARTAITYGNTKGQALEKMKTSLREKYPKQI